MTKIWLLNPCLVLGVDPFTNNYIVPNQIDGVNKFKTLRSGYERNGTFRERGKGAYDSLGLNLNLDDPIAQKNDASKFGDIVYSRTLLESTSDSEDVWSKWSEKSRIIEQIFPLETSCEDLQDQKGEIKLKQRTKTCKWLSKRRYGKTRKWCKESDVREKCSKTCEVDCYPKGRKSPHNFPRDDYNSIVDGMKRLADDYPNFVTLTTSQGRYGLPKAGSTSNHILIIEDKNRHSSAIGKKLSKSLPEVFFSGALHGDERNGPTVTYETARLLVLSAACNSGGDEISIKTACRELSRHKSTPWAVPWLARLVSTRRIVIVPMANALGFKRKTRAENGIDPNRDFAFDQSPSKCMKTIAGRTINEIFRESLFQISITFHSGIELIGWEWGNVGRMNAKKNGFSPDDEGQRQLSEEISSYCGSFGQTRKYITGSINNGLIYAVEGGMEDWAYGGSWDSKFMTTCNPSTYGGYSKSKTQYEDSTLRSFNLLVETSNDKDPFESSLGSDEDLFNPRGVGNGHISRNIRLTLMVADVVEPYSSIVSINKQDAPLDIVPGIPVEARSCISRKFVNIDLLASSDASSVTLDWVVGGSFTVDETKLMYSKWEDVPEKFNCVQQPTEQEYIEYESSSFTSSTSIQNGHTRWTDAETFSGKDDPNPHFSETIDLSSFSSGDSIAVFAVCVVDKMWAKQPTKVQPNVPPQSHVVNSRTNSDWNHIISNGKTVQGRIHWISVPVTINLQ
mmetsp:Transcript_16788/g.37751  ORF Transcript_16788/g.37751 Transcript_16788/m.37751 type:complete len:736 (-) Transcript_16788:43-2250(-)